jgi:hypothetical protein
MKLAKAIKKIEKRLGKKGCVTISNPHRNINFQAWVQHGDQILSFWTSNGGEDDCHLWHVRGVNDHSDPYTDYFAGTHLSNLTQALNWLQPAPSKFKKGDAVRFKDTKRNSRWGRAGKVGIVITDEAATDHWSVLLPDGTKQTYCNVRDIGLVV